MRRIWPILGFFLTVSCGLFRSPDYYPIDLGSVWRYESGEAVRTDSVAARTLLDSGDEVWMVLRLIQEDKPTLDTVFIFKDESKVLEYRSRAGTDPKRVLVLPLELGKGWEYTDPELGRVAVKVESELRVETQAGSFDCFELSHTTDTANWYEDFAPDVGLARFTLPDGREWRLMEY